MGRSGLVGQEPQHRAPRPELADYFDSLVGYDIALPAAGHHRGLPSSSLTFVIALSEPLRVGWYHRGDDAGADEYRTCVTGLHARPAQILHNGRQHGLMVAMTPAGARAIFGMPAAALSGTMCTVDDLVGGSTRSLTERLEGLPSWAQRFDVLEQILLELVAHNAAASARPDMGWAWRQLVGSAGRQPVRELAREIGWSRQHFSALFRREFGVGPKELGRISRFQSSVARLRAERTSLADLAADAGYADQAHLTREWRSLSGYSPSEYLREELPFLQDPLSAD